MLTSATLNEANSYLNSLVKNENLDETRVKLKAGKIKARKETAAHPDIPGGNSETYTPKTPRQPFERGRGSKSRLPA